MIETIALSMTALQAAGSVASFFGQSEQASKQNAYNKKVAQLQDNYRREQMAYQNDVWAQDLSYAREVLDYSKVEFDKQVDWANRALDAVEKNRNADAFTLMVRGIEENIAAALGTQSAAREGRTQQAKFQASDRGVEGNSVDAVIGDVARTVGEAQTVIEMNRSAAMRQLSREAVAADAQADGQAYQIASSIKTFSPAAPVRAPSPVQPTAPAAPVASPNALGLVSGLFNAAGGGITTYNSLSGQNTKETFSQLSSWASKQFTF